MQATRDDTTTERLDVVGIELIVDDLDRAVELLTHVFGATIVSRGPADQVAGEAAVLDAGAIVISLLRPADSGPGAVLSERQPRLTQIIFGAASGQGVTAAIDRAAEAGLSAAPLGDGRFHLTAESVEGALGLPVALVAVPVPADAAG